MQTSQAVLIGIKAVKDCGKVKDMFDTRQVQLFAFEMGFYETANWLRNHKDDYFLLYLTTNWDDVLSIYESDNKH